MRYLFLILFLGFVLPSQAQDMKERAQVRRGNKEYLKSNFESAIEHYNRAIVEQPEGFEARFNLSNALQKSKQTDEALELLQEIAADSLLGDAERAAVHYNMGNAYFEQKKLNEALESYKEAMRNDPADEEAKYNYAYTKALKQQQDQQQDQQDQNKDQNQDNKQNQDQQQGGNNDQQQNEQGENDQDDQQQDEQNQGDKQQDEQDGEQDEQNGQPQKPTQAQEQMLDAIQAQEDKTQEKLEEAKGVMLAPGGKNW